MTKEEIVCGNKLIAEYMGWKIDNSYPDKDRVWRSPAKDLELDTTMKFHLDWNLLIPVVEKCVFEIEGMGYDARGSWLPEHGYVSSVYLLKIHTPIDIVWIEVVKHIKRYKK